MAEYIRKLDTLSYSRLSTFERCQHMYNMLYNGFLNESNVIEFPERSTTQSLSFGQLSHRSIEFCLKNNKMPTLEDVFSMLQPDEQEQLKQEGNLEETFKDVLTYVVEVEKYVKENKLRYVSHEHKLDVELKQDFFKDKIDLSLYKKFGGDIDLVLKDADDNIILVDIKTAAWYYENKLKTDSFTQYQLAFYKFFYSVQENVSTNNIQQAFFILKKGNKNQKFECFKFTCGDKKISNALEVMRKMINKASNKKSVYMQNRSSCKFCDLKNTKFCKGSNVMKNILINN